MKKSSRILGAIILILLALKTIGFIFFPDAPPTAEVLFENHIMKPKPASVSQLECLNYGMPTLGDGSFILKFNMDPNALKALTSKLEVGNVYLKHAQWLKAELAKHLNGELKRFTYNYDDKISWLELYTDEHFNTALVIVHGFLQPSGRHIK